jgi:hypothetical protein
MSGIVEDDADFGRDEAEEFAAGEGAVGEPGEAGGGRGEAGVGCVFFGEADAGGGGGGDELGGHAGAVVDVGGAGEGVED